MLPVVSVNITTDPPPPPQLICHLNRQNLDSGRIRGAAVGRGVPDGSVAAATAALGVPVADLCGDKGVNTGYMGRALIIIM